MTRAIDHAEEETPILNNVLMHSLRFPLRAWWRSGFALGYQYRAMEALAPDTQYLAWGRLPNGCKVECDLSEHVERQIYFRNVYELLESWLFYSMLRPGMCVVDAGANIGQYSMLAATKVGPQGRVHSFEPMPRNFQRLTANLANNGLRNVFANQTALWREPAELTFGMPEGFVRNSGSYAVQPTGNTAVQATTLDLYTKDFERLDIIKIDVEGAEGNVLLGAAATLRKFKPAIFMEVNRGALRDAGISTAELWGALQSLGYRAWRICMLTPHYRPLTNLEGADQFNILAHTGSPALEDDSDRAFKLAFRWAIRNKSS